MTFPASDLPRQSLAFSRDRDERIRWLLDTHPVTAAMLVEIGWFPTRTKALKRLGRLVQKKNIRLVGTVCRSGGRPEHVYCRWAAKANQLLHEVELTQLLLRVHAEKIHRGPRATDPEIRPDAELFINGYRYFLELDRGTMGYAQLETRFSKYQHSPHLVLWVCPTEARREGLRSRAEGIRSTALFTTLAEALASPHDAIWIDYGGER